LLALVAPLLLFSPGAARAVDVAFAHNFLTGSKQVVSFPVGSPSNQSLVGAQPDTFIGMDFDPAGNVLRAVNFTAQSIGTINTSTGAYTSAAPLQGGCCSAFTIDPLTGDAYAAIGNDLYRIDTANAAVTQIAEIAAAVQITALAVDCAGHGYAYATDGMGDLALYRWLDVASAPVGPAGYTGATSLEFDNVSGTLYAWFNASGATSSTHVVVNPDTAVESSATVLEGRYRMAIRNSCDPTIFADGFEGG
jgi:hypothetical protein